MAHPSGGVPGTYFSSGNLWLSSQGKDTHLMSQESIRLRGEHNLLNVLAACAIASSAGFTPASMVAGVEGFAGVPHRLEFIRTWNEVDWYNDSIATAPERTAAAIHSFNEPLVLLLGGRDKNLPWEDLASLVCQRVDHLVVFGECAPKILDALRQVHPGEKPYTVERVADLKSAVNAAAQVAEPGDVVLLSPGGTSFDEFKDFAERGERFTEWVNKLS
jgi:UDP-N-acetylmuramoylalanine--D-glutamate ligase